MKYFILILTLLMLTSCLKQECPAPKDTVQITRSVDNKQLACLTRAIYHEARGEEFDGQVAVANVVLNRLKSKQYPSTICGVVYQSAQFTDIEKCKPDTKSKEWKFANWIAMMVYTNQIGDPTKGALFYYAPQKVRCPKWAKKKKVTIVIDHHLFLTG